MTLEDKLLRLRHSTAHVMAEAVLEMFPNAHIAIGPPIDNGFYYDFDLPRNLVPEDLGEIETRMKEIIRGNHDFTRKVISRQEAWKLFSDQPYKQELIEDLDESEELSVYQHSTFIDLCRGPHIENTKQINPEAFKLLSIAGAYWRGDEKRAMLQRIYGTVWQSPKELRTHLHKLEELEKRDHRKLGRELDLFSTHEEAGAGLIYWHPKGARIRSIIEDFWRKEHFQNRYEILYTPHMGKSWLWETSGHLQFYQENMYAPMQIDETDYYIKPMNCPFHILIYKSSMRSYRDLPFRWAELGTVYRYERSGTLHGLLRVRGFTQDDAHIFCTPNQIEDEILEVLRFSMRILQAFGFKDIKAYLSTKPDKAVGEDDLWERAQGSLKNAIELEGLDYEIDEGAGVFYGPKIDLKIKDALGREWQLTTIQFDFNLPERFNMAFVDQDGQEKRPYMVHRALLGSLERFFGVLTEHYAGAFPIWLSPVQVAVIPVSKVFFPYSRKLYEKIQQAGFRATIDESDDRMNAKIRCAQTQKIPCMLIIGEKEESGQTVSLRLRTGEQRNQLSVEDFLEWISDQVSSKQNA